VAVLRLERYQCVVVWCQGICIGDVKAVVVRKAGGMCG